MREIFKILAQNKKTLVLIIGLGLILSLIPLQFAEASPWDWLKSILGLDSITDPILQAIGTLLFKIFSLAIGIVVLIAGIISAGVTAIITWVIDICLKVPITNAGIVKDVGWPFARDFVNMLFILILVFIGLATILKIRDYGAKKALPLLILMALLINFSLVIVGFVVDMGNIVTNYFLEATKRIGNISSLGEIMGTAWNYFSDIFTTFDLGTAGGHLAYGIALTIFYFFSAFIFFIIALLFFFRIIILWVLAILAPFAFACYILPATRRWWGMWWNQLILWAIIGIPIGFFMCLAVYIHTHIPIELSQGFGQAAFEAQGIDVTSGMSDFIGRVLASFVSLAILGLGVLLSMQLAPSGASGIISFGKRGGKAVGAFAVGATRGIPAVSRAEEAARRRMETIPVLGRVAGGPGAYEREKRRKMEALGKPFEALPPEEIRRALRVRPFTYEDKLKQARLFEILREKRQLTDEERKYLPMAQRMKLEIPKILERRPDWAPDIGKTIEETMVAQEPETFRKEVQKEGLRDPEVIRHFMLDEMKFREMEEKGKAELKREIKNTLIKTPSLTLASFPSTQQPFVKARAIRINLHPRWQV